MKQPSVAHVVSLFVVTVALALALTGCIGPNNDRVATYQKIGDRYLIDVSGTRVEMAHDLIPFLKHETYKDKWQFDVPRIEGKIDGREIPPTPRFFSYVGSISIHANKMVVKLSFDNYDSHRLDPLSWNGTYTLVEKK